MSNRRSFGSDYNPCSQSRKISIGVVVDSSAKTRPTSAFDRVTGVVPNTKKVTSSNANSLENAHKRKGYSPHSLGKQIEGPCQVTSPWISTRSFYQKVSSSEAIVHAKQDSNLLSSSNVLKPSGNHIMREESTHSDCFLANQVSILQSGSVHQKKIVSVASQEKSGDDGNMGRTEEFLHAPANEALLAEEPVTEKTNVTGNSGSDTLRKKLWEILGTGFSPNKQIPSFKTLEAGTIYSTPSPKIDEKASSMIKCIQHSDTIESDSDSPDHSIRRPVTRSLTRKKPHTKAPLRKNKMAPMYHEKQAHFEDNIFSFEEEWSQRLHFSTTKSKRVESEIKVSRIDPYSMCFFGKDNAYKTQQEADRTETKTAAKSSLLGDGTGILGDPPCKNSELVEPTNGLQGFHQPPAQEMKGQPGNVDLPILEEDVDQHEDYSNWSPTKIVSPQCVLKNPTCELKTPSKNSSPCSSSETDYEESDDGGPAEGAYNMEDICNLKSYLNPKGADYKANGIMGLPNCVRELEDFSGINPEPHMEEQVKESRLFGSPCEEGNPESSEDGSPITSYKEAGLLSPEIGTAEKPVFVLNPAKRYRRQGAELSRFGYVPTCLEGIPLPNQSLQRNEGNKGLHGHLEQNGEDDLASAVTLFALASERFKRKMHSMTSKRAADILMSVSEKIHLQLQNAESQIQADVGNLISVNKVKRKRLQTRFQEQEERLKLIYERFKEEVNQHLRGCKSTVEELEVHQKQFQGTIEKQKVSHRKLLLQAKEEIETQVDDAQRRITIVEKVAREKMLQVKYVIAESLKDYGGVLS